MANFLLRKFHPSFFVQNTTQIIVDTLHECCYGNQVADKWDQRYLKMLLTSFWSADTVNGGINGESSSNVEFFFA